MATDLGLAPHGETDTLATWDDAGDLVAGPTTRGSAKSGYTLWAFDGTSWKMTKDRSEEGYGPSAAPATPGRFRGQVRAILSVATDAEPSA